LRFFLSYLCHALKKEKIMKSVKSFFVVLALALTTFAVSAGSALAASSVGGTAANTQISNIATLNFTGCTTPITAKVTVQVALVVSDPTVTIPAPSTAAYTGPNTPAITDTVTIIANANGPATYTITPAVPSGGTTNVLTQYPATVSAASTTVSLGASITTGTSGTTYVTVPTGLIGTAVINGSTVTTVNGIGIGSTIVFTVNGHTYTELATSTTDNKDGTFAIGWATPITDIPPAGTMIAEMRSVNLTVLPGTMQSADTPNITVKVIATVTTAGAGNTTGTGSATATNTWTTSPWSVTFNKYVRNATPNTTGNSNGNGLSSITINGQSYNYYKTGVTAMPGETLEYVVVATNNGSIDLPGCTISDLIPTTYVTLATPSPYGSKDVFYVDPTGATASFTAATVGANQASFVAGSTPNLVVNVGNGASNSVTGTIPAGKSVTIAYQVTVK